MAIDVPQEALQIHGGIGYIELARGVLEPLRMAAAMEIAGRRVT